MSAALRAYCPYGHHQNQASPAFMLGFNGERYDPFTRMYTLGLGYRNYSTAIMRFQAPDELSPFGKGGLNAYAYCAGDPVNFVDITGRARTVAQMLRKREQTNLASVSTPIGYQQQKLASKLYIKHNTPTYAATRINNVTSKEGTGGGFRERAMLTKLMGATYDRLEPLVNELDFLLLESTERIFNRFTMNTGHLKRVDSLHTHLADSRDHFANLNMKLQQVASNRQIRS